MRASLIALFTATIIFRFGYPLNQGHFVRKSTSRIHYAAIRGARSALAAKKKLVDIQIPFDDLVNQDLNQDSMFSLRKSAEFDGLHFDSIPKDDILTRLLQSQIPTETCIACLVSANTAMRTWSPIFVSCGFLSASQQLVVRNAFDIVSGLRMKTYGGYPQAERQRIAFHRIAEELEYTANSDEVFDGNDFSYIKIVGNFIFEKFTIDEFRTRLINVCGVDESYLGDIILNGNTGFQIVVDPSISAMILSKLQNYTMGTVLVKSNIITASELSVKAPAMKEVLCY